MNTPTIFGGTLFPQRSVSPFPAVGMTSSCVVSQLVTVADPGVSRGGASRTINIVLVGNSTEVVLLIARA